MYQSMLQMYICFLFLFVFQVVLPIGTIVAMAFGAENSINVWIQASATDKTPSGFNQDPKVLGNEILKFPNCVEAFCLNMCTTKYSKSKLEITTYTLVFQIHHVYHSLPII